MKLSALQPKWIGVHNWESTAPFYQGVSFLCPHCAIGPCPTCGKPRDYRLTVMFWPPIDPERVATMFAIPIPDNGEHRRDSGDTFDTLTLSPSIGFDNPPHFHGFIKNGEVTNQLPNSPWAQEL
jgi:hypothetical protein